MDKRIVGYSSQIEKSISSHISFHFATSKSDTSPMTDLHFPFASQRFARVHRNDLWQGDIKYGLVIRIGGKPVQTYMSSLIDDATRYIMQNCKAVVIVDEAHLLQKEMLEEARFLLNFNMDSENPLALILSGQNELWEKLRLSAYRAILERVDIECFLTPMDLADTKRYVEAQLRYSGCKNPIFTDDALNSIFKFSGGNPRLINRACNQSLIYAAQSLQNNIDSRAVDIVLQNEVTGVYAK